MKITDLKTILAGQSQKEGGGGGAGRNWVIVKVETSDGTNGYGEATLEGRERTMETAVLELRRYLIGKDPTEIERHWQSMYRYTFWKGGAVLASALSGVEQALWDILGKSLGCPVYKLLGGACRDKIRVYTHVSGTTPQELAENARRLVKKEGFTALKLLTEGANEYDVTTLPEHGDVMPRRPVRETLARVEATRNAVGEKVDIMLDAHGRLDPRTAIILATELQRYNILFFEEPIPPENVKALARVCRAARVPIATGERLYTKYDFARVFEENAIDVIQPDVCHAGGILECKKIAAMAECHYVTVAPHNPNGPVGSLAALHLDACTPNFLIQEMIRPDRAARRANAPIERSRVEAGYVALPDAPGLGVELDESRLDASSFRESDLPLVHYDDGSVADW